MNYSAMNNSVMNLSMIRRFACFVLFSFLVSTLCVQDVLGQRGQGGQPGGGQRFQGGQPPGGGQRPQGGQPPGGGQRPVGPPVQPAAAAGEVPTAEGEEPAEPTYQPPPLPPADSLERIIDPGVADQLQLTADQRNRAFQIINARTLEIANAHVERAPPERFQEIYKRAEDALSNLLTGTQKARLTTGLDGKRYQMSRVRQPWADVLRFIAEEGGFHLIMTAPPPGTFTHIDPAQLTIIEVLDLVNGILITEGFTVTRRDRVLQVLNLRSNIPSWSFPTVPVHELRGRASSEFISVTHNWGRRPSSEVLPALEPLRTNNPFMRWYPSGNSVTVIDRAEIHNAIQAIINGITEPPPPPPPLPQPPRQPDPPPPEWRKHTVEKLDPEMIITRWREFVPNFNHIHLKDSKDIHVNARPAEHDQLAEILKMLEGDSSIEGNQENARSGNQRVLMPHSITPLFESPGTSPEAQRERLRQQNMRGAFGAQGEEGEQGGEGEQSGEPAEGVELPPEPPPVPLNPFARLIDPVIADRLGLTPAQRNEVQRLITVQALTLSHAATLRATEEQIAAIYTSTNEALSALLTEPQRAVLERELARAAENNVDNNIDEEAVPQGFEGNKIRIISHNQPWAAALQSIADQGGFQLMLTVTPPGTFNYTDPEERSIAEVLAFLNSLLITDGYTIVRRERILQVINLRNQNPPWVFPVITVEELPKRAPNEFVAVMYSFGRRPQEQVMQRLNPRRNEFTQIIPMGTHILLIDRVERHNAIPGIIQGIQEPEQTPRQEQEQREQQEYQQQRARLQRTSNPPQPVWTTYTIDKHNPEEIRLIFRQYVSGAQVMRLGDSQELHIFARPNEHTQIVNLLKMLEDDDSVVRRGIISGSIENEGEEGEGEEEGEVRAESTESRRNLILLPYSITPYFEPPGTTLEAQRERLRQQQRLQGAPGAVGAAGAFGGQPPGGGGQLGGRGMGQRGAFPGGTFPGATPGMPPGTGGFAPPRPLIPPGVDIDQMDPLQLFGLEIIAALRQAFPDAQIADVPIGGRLLILASPEDHQAITDFLEALKPSGENRQSLHFYSYTEPGKTIEETTVQLLRALVPGASLSFDAARGQILAVASAREHEALAQAVREFEAAADPMPENILRPYRLSATVMPAFVLMVQQLAAQDKLRGYTLIEDAPRNQVLILATAEQHELIQNVYQEITGQSERRAGGDGVLTDAVVIFTPRNISLDTLLMVIEDIYPAARIMSDDQRGQLIVRVRPEQKEPLELLLKQLDAADPEEEKRYFKAYPVENVFYSLSTGWNIYRPVQFQEDLEKLAPRAKIVFDPQSLQLIVWGTVEEHGIIESAIKHLIGDGDERAKTIERVSLRRTQPGVIMPIIRRIYPVELALDGNALIVEGHPRLLPKVRELIDLLDPEEPSENDPIVMFYKFDVQPQSLWTIVQGLQNIVPPPRATYVPDARNQQIMVIARPADQKLIERSTDLIIASFKEPEREIQRFEIRRFNPLEIGQIVQRRFPEVTPTSDWRMPGVLIVEGDSMLLPKVAELIEAIDPLQPTENDAVVVYYSLKVAPTWELITGAIQGLQQLAPGARITNMGSGRIMVVARPSDQNTIKGNTALVAESFSELEREVRRIELNRMPYWQVQSTLQRLYPTIQVSFNTTDNYLVVEAFPELMPKIVELIRMLDPAEPTANDPLVKFYALKTAPTPEILQGLRQVAPFPAQIIPDPAGRRVMVFAKPAVHRQIETSVDAIVEAFEEPVLVIYEATREERVRLEAFMMMAAPELREVRIIPEGGVAPGQVLPIGGGGGGAARFLQLQLQSQQGGGTPAATNRITIWARPTEHELITTVLTQIRESQANIPDRELKSFPMSVADLTIAQSILQASIPDAMLFPDPALNRLMVWATPEDMGKVTDTLLIQGSIDDREMMVYPVAGVTPETLRTVILEIFQGLKITAEARRILVWATPEEHVQIAQIVEEANKEVDPESELAEKFVAYSAVNIDVAMVLPLFQSLIPEADVHAAPGSEKIVVRAIARDHTRIEELFTQLREKDESLRLKMMIYQFGETDPVMIEALLRNQLKEAESLSPDDLVMRVSSTYYYERMNTRYYYDPWYIRQTGMLGMALPSQTVKVGYYNVDPQTRSVQVFATEEQHEIIREAIEQIVEAANQPGLKLIVQRYALNESGDMWTVQQLIQRIAPSALLIPIYEPYLTPAGWYSSRNTGDFLAYTYESEHEKLDTLVKELNDKGWAGRKEMLTIALPENTPFSRERIIETIQRIYTDITPMPGGTPNQILVWAPQHRLEQVQKIVDEIAQPLPVGERTIPKSYPLQYISVEEATAWLGALYPNVLFNPDDAVRPPFVRPDAAKFIVAVATPLEHAEIAQTIEELDKDLPDTFKMMSRAYTVENMPLIAFQNFYATVTRLVPNAVLSPFNSTRTIMVVASEEDHRKVSEFVETYREDVDRLNPYLEVYTLQRQNYYLIAPLLQRVAPGAFLSVGSAPQQVMVWGTSKEQADIADTLAQLETAAEAELDHRMAIYKTGTGRAGIVQSVLQGQFPGAIIFPLNQNELFVWAAPAVHESIEPSLASLAEVFPEPELRPYFFKHVQLGEGTAILQQAFAGQAISITPRADDLMVFATPDIHEKIAASIANFDILRPEGVEPFPKTYDLSILPPGTYPTATWQLSATFGNRIQILPSIVPGQLVISARQADHDRVANYIEQMLTEHPAAISVMKVYTVHRGNARVTVDALIRQIVPNVRIDYGANPNQLLVWTRESEHVKVKDIIDRVNESDADMSVKTYLFNHVSFNDGWTILQSMFLGSATFTPRSTTGELMVFASSDVHDQIAASIAAFDVERPEGMDMVPKFYDMGDLPADAFIAAAQQIRLALQFRVTVIASPIPGQMIVWARPADHEKVEEFVKQILVARTEPKTYDLSDLSPLAFEQALVQIPQFMQGRVQTLRGAVPGQLIVVGRPTDLERVDTIVEQMLHERPDAAAVMAVYTVHRGNARTIEPLIRQIVPNVRIDYGSNPNQILVWTRESEHVKIKDVIDRLNESDADVTMKVYHFEHVLLHEALPILQPVFAGSATLTPRYTTGDLLVFAAPEVHEQVAASIASFDVPRPAAIDSIPKVYDVGDMPAGAVAQAATQITIALQYRVQVVQGAAPGQLVVWARPADHEKVDDFVKQMLSARTEQETKYYNISTLPLSAQWQVPSQIQQALQWRVQAMASAVPGQIIVVGRPVDIARVDAIVEQLITEHPDATATMRVYSVNRSNARAFVEQMIRQIAPTAQPSSGPSANQVVVWAKAADHLKIEEAIAKLNETDPDITLRVYRTGAQRVPTAQTLLAQQFPGLLVFPASPNELVAWATSAEHAAIADVLKTIDEAFPQPVLKTYFFKHIPLGDGAVSLQQTFAGMATITIRTATDDLLVYAAPEVHERIAASIEGFDIPRPTETEAYPQVYDLSDLPAIWVNNAVYQLPVMLGNRIITQWGLAPGQIIVWGKQPDQERVEAIVSQMLSERPETTAEVQVYTVRRNSNMQDFRALLPRIAPSAQPSLPNFTNPSQITIWAKPSDHIKLTSVANALNEAEPDIQMQLHALRNINYAPAVAVLYDVVAGRGLDVRWFFDTFGNQLVVLASPEDQVLVAGILDSLRSEDRETLVVRLEYNDPEDVEVAVMIMFGDEPDNAKPFTRSALNTNTLTILGTPSQLERIAKMLRDMGEDIWYPEPPAGMPRPGGGGGMWQPPSTTRTIHIQGNPDMLRQMQLHWQQMQPNPLRIVAPPQENPPEVPEQGEEEPGDETADGRQQTAAERGQTADSRQQQREASGIHADSTAVRRSPSAVSLFSLEDEIQRESPETTEEAATLFTGFPAAEPVYVIVNPDSSLTLYSEDTRALDQLEALLRRISSGIIFEGRDYTIFSVRNTSSDVVVARLNMALREKIMQQVQPQQFGAAPRPRLIIQPDIPGGTIYVQGSRADRNEVGRLIPQFDVSDLPGTPAVQKPETVYIENTEAIKVYTAVMQVYQLKLQSTRGPGGAQPRIYVNNVSNTLEIFASEPLLGELKKYIEEVDRKALEESRRGIQVIPLRVKANVLSQAMWQVQSRFLQMQNPYGMMPMMQPMQVMPMQMMPMQQFPMQQRPMQPMQPMAMPRAF